MLEGIAVVLLSLYWTLEQEVMVRVLAGWGHCEHVFWGKQPCISTRTTTKMLKCIVTE